MSDIKSNIQTTFSKDIVEDVSSHQPTINNIHPTLHVDVEPPTNENKGEYRPDVNILFLGEAGVGKSTFINAFVNYLKFNTLEEAMSGQLIDLVPIQFTVTDDSFEDKVIKFGCKPNELQLTEQTVTQDAKDYVLYLNGAKIRLIDTPGIDVSSEKFFEDLLQFISQFKQLHAICIVEKSKKSNGFKNRIEYLLSRFEKEAIKNIIFLFTHSRNILYPSGRAMSLLKKSLDEINSNSSVLVPFEKKNVFFIDCVSFHFLLAVRDKFDFSETENDAKCSWKLSSEECIRIILYITDGGFKSLMSHHVPSTIMINEVRRLMRQLAESTIKIIQIIRGNVVTLETQKHLLSSHKQNRDNLLLKTNNNLLHCLGNYTNAVNEMPCVTINRLCHNPCICYPKVCQLVDSNGNCSSCRQSRENHWLLIFETDENLKSQISTKEQQIKDTKQSYHNSQKTAKEFKKGVKSFIKLIVRLQYLVNHLNITSCEDGYEEYWLKNLKLLEKSADGDNYFNEILELYKKEKNSVVECLQCGKSVEGSVVLAATVKNLLSTLEEFHKLQHFGEILKNSADTGRLKDAVELWLNTE